MNILVYWLLLILLLCLLLALSGYLIFNVFKDFCLKPLHHEPVPSKEQLDSEEFNHPKLHKHHFHKSDVEDLTKIEKNYKTDIPRFSFSNEISNRQLESQLTANVKTAKEENAEDKYYSTDAINVTENESNENIDVLDLADPNSLERLKAVLQIESEAKKVENDMNQFRGGANNLQFYEINERYITLMIRLCDINCQDQNFRKKKYSVLEYIEQCQSLHKLKSLRLLDENVNEH